MGGQVLGGGVIVLVAVLLWLVYLLPSWQGRHRFDAAERNAVRLNQALRVLAETSETPQEVRLELNARTALAQQKLARRAQLEREQRELENARAEQEAAQARAAAEAAIARQRAVAERERALAEARLAAAAPEVRRARARRRARLVASAIAVLSLAAAAWGVYELVTAGAATWLVVGVVIGVVALTVLQRMAAVQRRAAVRAVATPRERDVAVASVPDFAVEAERTAWVPRELPRPLTASAGSRAAAFLDGAAAQEAVRQAAFDEAVRAQAARTAPPSLDEVRRSRPAAASAEAPDFARMGYVDDAAIEEHVRSLLERRAAGM